MTSKRIALALLLTLSLVAGATMTTPDASAQAAAKPVLDVSKTLAANLADLSGKSVTIHLRSGETLSGVVQAANAERLHLSKLTGKDFFDALVSIEAIDAIEARAR